MPGQRRRSRRHPGGLGALRLCALPPAASAQPYPTLLGAAWRARRVAEVPSLACLPSDHPAMGLEWADLPECWRLCLN